MISRSPLAYAAPLLVSFLVSSSCTKDDAEPKTAKVDDTTPAAKAPAKSIADTVNDNIAPAQATTTPPPPLPSTAKTATAPSEDKTAAAGTAAKKKPPGKTAVGTDERSAAVPKKKEESTSPTKATEKPASSLPSYGKKCASGDKCAKGLECITFYGIAGPRGPKFKQCERRCGKGRRPCPNGMRCAVIADGPGQVCR